jgi:hypothetical protein
MKQPAQLHNEFLSKIISNDMLDEARSFVSENYSPEEVYDEMILEEWATNNGFVREEEFM